MISPTLATLSADLRSAASRKAYTEVRRLAVRAGEAALEEVRALPAGDPGIDEIAVWLGELFTCAEILCRISRAAQADALRQAVCVQRYTTRQGPPVTKMRLQL
jgi:hypothetical protein